MKETPWKIYTNVYGLSRNIDTLGAIELPRAQMALHELILHREDRNCSRSIDKGEQCIPLSNIENSIPSAPKNSNERVSPKQRPARTKTKKKKESRTMRSGTYKTLPGSSSAFCKSKNQPRIDGTYSERRKRKGATKGTSGRVDEPPNVQVVPIGEKS